MTYTEFIEKIKAKAHEELHYSYDMMTFYNEGYTSDDPQTLELIMNSNAVYVGGEPSPWLKTDILVLMDIKDDKITSLQRIATKKLYEELQKHTFEELFAQIKQEYEASVRNASAIHDRADYGKIQLILRPLNYQLHEQGLYDAVYKRFDDVALVLYQLIEAKVSNKTPLDSKTDFISSRINKKELKKWNVTEEQVLDDALKNTCRLFPPHVFNLRTGKEVNFLTENLKKEDLMMGIPGIKSILLSTSVTTNGAVALFYPGVVEKMMRILGGAFWAMFMDINDVMIFEKDNPIAQSALKSPSEGPITSREKLSEKIYLCDEKGIRAKN